MMADNILSNSTELGAALRIENGALRDLGDRISVLGVELKKLSQQVSTPSLSHGLESRLRAEELILLQKVAISLELNQPLLLRGLAISEHLPALRFLCDASGRELIYADARNHLVLREIKRAVERGALLALEPIEALASPLAGAAVAVLQEVLQAVESGKQSCGGGLKIDKNFRLLAASHAPPLATSPQLRELFSCFTYAHIGEAQNAESEDIALEGRLPGMVRRAARRLEEGLPRVDLLRGQAIEKLAAWPEVDRKIRQFINAVAEMIKHGQLRSGHQEEISVVRHYPRVIKFMWRFYDGDLGRTARRALRHVLYGHFDCAQDRACLHEMLRHVAADSKAVSQRIAL